MIGTILAIGVALIAGALTKMLSKRSGLEWHKILSPLAAAIAGGLTTTLTAPAPDPATAGSAVSTAVDLMANGALKAGGSAVLIHTLAKNAWQLVRKLL